MRSSASVIGREKGEIIAFRGIRLRVLEEGLSAGHRIGAAEFTVAPGAPGPPRHVHRMHDETFLMLSGTLRFWVGDGEYDVPAGGFVTVPTGAPHSFANPFAEPAVFFNTFTPSFYIEFFREMAALESAGAMSPEAIRRVMGRYATDLV